MNAKGMTALIESATFCSCHAPCRMWKNPAHSCWKLPPLGDASDSWTALPNCNLQGIQRFIGTWLGKAAVLGPQLRPCKAGNKRETKYICNISLDSPRTRLTTKRILKGRWCNTKWWMSYTTFKDLEVWELPMWTTSCLTHQNNKDLF